MKVVERTVFNSGNIACDYSFGETHVSENLVTIHVPDSVHSIHTSHFSNVELWLLASGIEDAAKFVLKNYTKKAICELEKVRDLINPKK